MTPLISIGMFIVAVSGCYFVGEAMLSRIMPDLPAGKAAYIAVPLGMGAAAYSIYFLGSMGIIHRWELLAVFLLAVIVAIFFRKKRFSPDTENTGKALPGEKGAFLIILLFSGISLFGALTPPVGTDSLCYHLGIPSKFIMQGKVGFVPYTMNSLYPFFMEMLYTAMEIFGSGVAAKLFHWICGPLTVLSILFFAEEISERKAGLIASVLFISSPGIFNGMTYAYVDVGLTLYITLSVLFFVLWDREAADEHKNGYLMLSGIFMGMALSIKYLALYMFMPMFVLLLWRIARSDRTRRRGDFLRFILPCFLLSFFWYLKSYIVLGNPVFPAFFDIFPGVVTFDVSRHMEMGTGKGILSFLRLPWDMFMHPGIFGGRGSQVGIQFSLFVPFVIYSMFDKKKWIKDISFLTAAYIVVWFFLVQRDRFLYPVLPLLGLLSGHSIAKLLDTYRGGSRSLSVRLGTYITAAVFTAALLFNMAVCIYHNRHNYPVVLKLESEDAYLKRWVPNYGMAEYVNKNLPPGSRILGIGIYKPYYFKRWVVRENIFDLWEGYSEKFVDAGALKSFLKDKGFTYVIYNRREGLVPPAYVQKIINSSTLVYSYGPVRNIETGREEAFYLYKL